MRLRATYRAPAAARYRSLGGAWDVPVLDSALRTRPKADRDLIVDGSIGLSAGGFDLTVERLAGALAALGVRRGSVVAWQLPNWWEAIALYRAVWRCGGVAAPIHHQVGEDEVRHMVGVLEPTVLFASEALPLSGFDGVLGVRDRADRFLALCHETEPLADDCPSRPSDLAAVIFTSGSTGRPKAVLHTQRSLAYKARLMARVHGLGPGDAVLMPAPLAHISGLLNAVLVPGAAGMRVVLMERWDPARGLGLIEEQRVSYMIGPPSIFNGLMEQPGFDRRKVASMRVVSSGMLGVSPEFIAEATRGLGAVVKRSYGSTEAPTVSTCTNEDASERCRDTDGRAVGDAEIKVVDPSTGRRRPPGRSGEVWVRGPELFAGYAEATETEAAVHRGWFRTGDLGVLDAEGWLAITGRLKELIIRGGENISPAEVERALELHPEVVGAVAVGVPDDRLGERVCAFVVARSPIDVEVCRRWFAELGIARFKAPELVVQVDALPLLAAGKPDRASLKARAAGLSGAGRPR